MGHEQEAYIPSIRVSEEESDIQMVLEKLSKAFRWVLEHKKDFER